MMFRKTAYSKKQYVVFKKLVLLKLWVVVPIFRPNSFKKTTVLVLSASYKFV